MVGRLATIGLLMVLATTGALAQVVLAPAHYQLECDLDFRTEVLRGTSRIDLRNPSGESVREASLLLYRLMRVKAVRYRLAGPDAFRRIVGGFSARFGGAAGRVRRRHGAPRPENAPEPPE